MLLFYRSCLPASIFRGVVPRLLPRAPHAPGGSPSSGPIQRTPAVWKPPSQESRSPAEWVRDRVEDKPLPLGPPPKSCRPPGTATDRTQLRRQFGVLFQPESEFSALVPTR